jgi:hypothetical protein
VKPGVLLPAVTSGIRRLSGQAIAVPFVQH